MSRHREILAFLATLSILLGAFFHESLLGGKVLSPADVLRAQKSFQDQRGSADHEPGNRQLIDPVLQFQPWLEFSRSMLRSGRLPLWNPLVGCGAPHLANGQAAVFDPFHAIAYLGELPGAYALMAFARLWVAGLGMFLLARRWDLGPWGRWFAGLVFPLCGFLVVWLQFPVTSVAVWLPWLLLATDSVIERPRARSIAALGLCVGAVLLGGHVQTSAHVLLFSGIHAVWTLSRQSSISLGRRGLFSFSLGVMLGLMLAAIEVLPLAAYLARSPVWGDRAASKPTVLAIEKPRLLESACTALPYLFGSQRKGHPHLAKGLGVQNLNESAGGFAGLATLIWLAPLGVRSGNPRARFLAAIGLLGALAAFGIPPVPNLLRMVPILDVADNRRLTLWVAFSLVMLGGIGLDRLSTTRPARLGIAALIAGAFVLIVAAIVAARLGPVLLERAERHYARAASETPGADPTEYRRRAVLQVDRATHFLPRYLGIAASELLFLTAIATGLRKSSIDPGIARTALFLLTITEMFAFGFGLNPAIDRQQHAPESELIAYLKRHAAPPRRILGIGGELPPNSLMRFGLADVRNYDSVELSTGLDRLAPLFDAEPGRSPSSSRRTISWSGVSRSRGLLDAMNVAAVVSASPPPSGIPGVVGRVGEVWVLNRAIDARVIPEHDRPGEFTFDLGRSGPSVVTIPETFDPGWTAEVDGREVAVSPGSLGFIEVRVPPGSSRLALCYRPIEVKVGVTASLFAIGLLVTMIGAPDSRPSLEKRRGRSWRGEKALVRIVLRDLRRPCCPAYHDTEGRDADGPLHV